MLDTGYYFSIDENDGNTGNSGSPFATVTKAFSMASDTALTIIYIQGGNYSVKNLTIHKNIKIVNNDGGVVSIGK